MSFGDSMGTMFNRAKQLASESLSDGVKTEYEPEVIILIGQLEKTREWTKRFLERQMELIQPNPALRAESFFHETFDLKKPDKMTNTERFGSNLEAAAHEIDNSSTAYTQGLKRFGKAERELGLAERRFGREVEKSCILPMRKFLSEEFDAAFKEKSALDTLRLDLDVAKSKYAKAKGMVEQEKADKVLQAAQKDFDRQQDFTKVIIGRTLNSHHNSHTIQLKELQRLQTDYYKECSLIMRELEEEFARVQNSS